MIFTFGYEGLSLSRFFSTLQLNDIERIIDVRQMPLSRKKGFSKNALAEAAASHNIDYIHKVALGCPRFIRDQYRLDSNWQNYERHFQEYIETQNEEVEVLISLCERQRCCLLCFEANALSCHRSLIARRTRDLSNTPLEIVHLTAASIVRHQVLV